jgi:hypothetical protein
MAKDILARREICVSQDELQRDADFRGLSASHHTLLSKMAQRTETSRRAAPAIDKA